MFTLTPLLAESDHSESVLVFVLLEGHRAPVSTNLTLVCKTLTNYVKYWLLPNQLESLTFHCRSTKKLIMLLRLK